MFHLDVINQLWLFSAMSLFSITQLLTDWLTSVDGSAQSPESQLEMNFSSQWRLPKQHQLTPDDLRFMITALNKS